MMSMRFVGVWVLVASALLGSSVDQLIDKVERHYNQARTLSVDFQEEYSLQGHPRPTESGKLTLRKQGKMRWDYSKPSGKVFVSDGKMVFLYTPLDNRVEKIPLKDTEDMRAPLAFLLGHLDLKKEFRDFTLRADGGPAWLDASAKGPKTTYGKIEMLISPEGQISRLNVVGRDASQLKFSLSGEQVNPKVDDALFAFKIPPGAEVVDAVEYAGEGR